MNPRIFRFGEFELDVPAYELRRSGRRVRLERRPMDLLILMVERRGELISRAEIAERLWGKDVFIELDTAVNTLVRKIRQALHDSADDSAFIETVPGKGYRFIAPVEAAAPVHVAPATEHVPVVAQTRPPRRRLWIVALLLLLVATLGAWRWIATRPRHIKLAVLPFEAINVGGELTYLADALHDETIAALGQIDPEYIAVITRSSMLGYRQTTKSAAEIARELDVDYLVGSAIHVEEGHVRVRARLIRADDQVEIWTDSYDDTPRSVLAFQRQLSLTIADQIRRHLSAGRLDTIARRHTGNAQAFQLYLQGLSAWNQLTPQTTRQAIEFYTRATQVDPRYALAWSGLALAYAGAPINADADPRVMAPLARRAAQQAIDADPRLAEALTAAGAIKFWFDREWPAAESLFRRAVAADPNYAFGQRMIGIVLAHDGRHGEAREQMRRLVEIEPTYAMNWALRAQVAFNAGDHSDALGYAMRAAELQPGFWIADYQRAMAYEQSGETDLALQTIDKNLPRGGNSKLHALRGYILGRVGRGDEARQVLATLDAIARDKYVPPYAAALVHAGLGEPDAAISSLQRACEEGDVHLVALPTDPKWNPFRKDAQFIALLDRCGFATRTQ